MKSVLVTSSILILLIAALRPILRGRIDPRAQYAMWLIVALRLLVPVEWATSAYSALALLNRAEEPRQIAESIGHNTVPVPVMSYEDAYDQALQEYLQSKPVTTDFVDLAEVEHRARELQAKEPTLAEVTAKYAKPVWLGGAALMAAWFLLVNLALRRKLRTTLLVETDCPLPVRVTPDLPSPCLCGVFRPVIYVTPDALADPDRMRHVLAHELTHCRHKDHWWALVRCLCLCGYWFNPLVWWAAAMSRQDCELACDAGAIRRLGEEERLAYGRTLVAMIASGRNSLLQTATTMTGGRHRVKERVTLIARKPKTVLAAALALAVVLTLAVGWTFTGAPDKAAAPMGLSTDSLQERLENIPEELRGEVTLFRPDTPQTGKSDVLVIYALDNTDPEWGNRLLTVRQLDQEGFEYWLHGIFAGYTDVFARDSDYYYALSYPSDVQYKDEDADRYAAASKAIGDYARKTVLETRGVEPYTGKPLDTLEARLLVVPDELHTEVNALRGGESTAITRFAPSVLVQYWMNRPYTNYEEGWGWLMTVYQWDQAQFEENYSVLTGTWECFARDENFYYVTARATDVRVPATEEMVAGMPGATEVETKYLEDFEAIRAFAKKTVLETEGVEPYDGSPPQPLETLQARLLGVPEELQDNVEAHADDDALAVYYFKKPGEELDKAQYLLIVNQFTQERFGEIFRESPSHGGCLPFARGGGYGYALYWNTSIEYDLEDQELFTAAYRAVSGYAQKTVLETEGVEPFAPSGPTPTINAVMYEIANAPGTSMTLYRPDASGQDLTYRVDTPPNEYWSQRLLYFVSNFGWEELTQERAAGLMEQGTGVSLLIAPSGTASPACITVYENSPLVAVRTLGNEMKWYQAKSIGEGLYIGDLYNDPGAYGFLRDWFDQTELENLRVTFVPDRGQSHHDVVKEWLERYEGAYTKCAPGSQFHCTYVEGRDIQSNWPKWFDTEQLEEFAQSHGLEASEFTKTWFGFRYSLLFLPADEYARNYMMAGNTHEYDGAGWDAPEGAMVYTRMAIMRLIDGNWTCESTGTSW